MTTTITIDPVSGTELHHRYPGQTSPQDAQVSLDCATGRLTAETDPETDPEIGNAVPMRQYHGHVQCWSIPALTADAANALLEEIAPLAERVVDGYTSRWDGHNHVADFNADAQEAICAIADLCDRAKADAGEGVGALKVWDAVDWFGSLGGWRLQSAAFGITGDTEDSVLGLIVKRAEEEAYASGECDALDGTRKHFEWLRNQAKGHGF